jgi:hypothetical protein
LIVFQNGHNSQLWNWRSQKAGSLSNVPLAHPRDRSGPHFVALERSIKQLVREEVQKMTSNRDLLGYGGSR